MHPNHAPAPYIESARAIGQSKFGVFWRHVLPQVWPVLPMVIAAELSAVTLLVAELGYLGFFIVERRLPPRT